MRPAITNHISFGLFLLGGASITMGIMAIGATVAFLVRLLLLPLLANYHSDWISAIFLCSGAGVVLAVCIPLSKPIVVIIWQEIYRSNRLSASSCECSMLAAT